MECVAKVALAAAPYAADKPYDYRVPDELLEKAVPGTRVIVPFGAGNRHSEGLILTVDKTQEEKKRKSIVSLLDESPVLDEGGVRLALWMRERYFCTVYAAARAMLPAGLWFSLKDVYSFAPGTEREDAYAAAGRSANARRVVDLLCAMDGKAELTQIREAFGTKDPNPALRQLTERGVLTLTPWAKRQVADKTELTARLLLPPEEALALVTAKRASAPLRYAVTELLCAVGSASAKEVCYFTGASHATLRSMEKRGILTLEKKEILSHSSDGPVPQAPPIRLNEAQERAYRGLFALCRSGKAEAALLYGVTGSGKTQVYMQLIQRVLDAGRTAMVLVPEIALTPQLLRLFTARFGALVAVLHSSLRAGERYDEWKRVRSGGARVVIGTRSAVFAPLQNLGLVILDEEQEATYKSESTPRYHALDIAKFRCAREKALLLLGSATPAVDSMYRAREGTYHLFRLEGRYNQRALPDVLIADMRKELRAGNGGSISALLQEELGRNLERGEQSILFLNRRGASRMVTCGECGEVPACPRCSVRLTYHSANGRLMCHYCGHSERLPDACPSCGGELNFIGTGTQRVQEELQALFPETEILRMDTDTVSAAHSHEALLGRFQNRRIPILVGTQMVAKGLDFENVTLVGVVAADLSLYIDHFRAAERTFSLLTQVAGRAGRGGKRGRAVVQTWTPENEVIRFAAAQDYDSFYEQEIALRRLMGFPPFADQFLLTASGPDEGAVLRACMRVRAGLDHWLGQPEFAALHPRFLGPAPAPVVKVNNRYRYRLTLLCANTKQVRALIAHLLRAAQEDKENHGVAFFADVNPLD